MPETTYLHQWTMAFMWTLLLEGAVVWFALREAPTRRRISAFLAANCLSHPLLWFAFPSFEPYWVWVVCAETTVVVYEGLAYWAILRPNISSIKAAAVSVAANCTSCLIGLLAYWGSR
jgi:hypothetical protein